MGHMRRRGLLDGAAETAFLEFGAGAGYLSLMLVACCDARTLVLVDSGTFRLKADRCALRALRPSLRSTRLTRVCHPVGLAVVCASKSCGTDVAALCAFFWPQQSCAAAAAASVIAGSLDNRSHSKTAGV